MTNDETPTEETTEAPAKRTPAKRAKPLSMNDPASYKGGRYVSRGTICGWCIDGFHESCKHEHSFFDKLYVCRCDCNKDWVPQDLGTGEIKPVEKPKPKPIEITGEEDEEEPEEETPEVPKKPKPIRRKASTSR